MSEIQKDIYHQILDSLNALKSNDEINFKQTHIKNFGIDNRSAYSMGNAKEDIIEYFMVSPNTPITDIDNLNEFMNQLLPTIKSTIKENAETYYQKPLIPIFKTKQRLNIGKMIFDKEYNIQLIDIESNKELRL
ncbi:MAG: hypothetical protein KAI18_01800, partial [Candidatus Aenigmarchaeota archaeon]|nr:hypothetical protein [Candidatus Aenigmarchaeota archaeon]